MFPLHRRVRCRFLFVFALSALLTNVAVADVELKASWTKGREHWLVHIQVARAGFFIAPNSPAFAALIYEFKTLGGGEATFVEPSEITGQMHLEKSGLLSALSRSR